MAELVLVVGKSGSGKSTSGRNLDPKTTYWINVDRKPLPLLSMEVKNLVKEYYKEDYERFNYEHRYLR